MASAREMPLQEVLQAFAAAPASDAQLRAVLAYSAARWYLGRGEDANAVRQLGAALEAMPGLRPAMRLLQRIYSRAGDVRSAVMYLDQEIRATRHPREAAALYRERGRLVETNFSDLEAALQCHQAALKATPRDLAVLRSVERVQLASGDVIGLAETLEAQLEVVKDTGASTGLLHEVALLEARPGGDLALAADCLAAALDDAPGHPGMVADLFRIAEIAGDAEMMLAALESEADARADATRAMPLMRASIVLRGAHERAAALQLMHAAAAANPDNLSLWRNLEELAMSSSRYDVAVEACLAMVRALEPGDVQLRADLFYRIGRLAMTRLDLVNEGLAAMRQCLRLYPNHIVAVEDAARHLISNGMWSQLLELVQLQINSEHDKQLSPDERGLGRLRAGQVLEERLNELDGARRLYEEASEVAPGYRPVRDRLERVLHQLEDRAGLLDYYHAELESSEGTGRKVFLLSVLGQLATSLERRGEAIKYLRSLLDLVPEHVPSLQRLARLLARAGRTAELLDITKHEIGLTVSAGRRAKLLSRSGELALEVGRDEEAREHFEAALDAVDDHAATLAQLERLYLRHGHFEELLGIVRRRLMYANDRDEQLSLRLEAASVLAQRLGRPDEALAELKTLLQKAPRHLPALHAAEQLAASLERWDELVELLERHASAVHGPRTRALLLHRCAVLRLSRLDDVDGAIRSLVRALDLWPQLGVARTRLLQLYESQGRNDELQAFAEAGLTAERGSDDRRALALQLAELSPRPVVAVQYLSTVAESRPDDYVTQMRLARSSKGAGRSSRAAGALRAAAESIADRAEDTDFVLALRYRAGRAEEAAGNLDAADADYAAVLDVDPSHALAQNGRRNVKRRVQRLQSEAESEALARAAAGASSPIERAAFANVRAELFERRGDLETAIELCDLALSGRADYIPALHTKVRVLQRLGGPAFIAAAIDTLETLADVVRAPQNQVRAMCRAGTLSLRIGTHRQPNPNAWRTFGRALDLDPANDLAFLGLRRTVSAHGGEGAPSLRRALQRRLEALTASGRVTGRAIRWLSQVALASDGPETAADLLVRGVEVVPDDPEVFTELAQIYAHLERWDDVYDAVANALRLESSPERVSALQFFAGDACQRGGRPAESIPHYIAAGRAGFYPVFSLRRAANIAQEVSDLEAQVSALRLLTEIGDDEQRSVSLRALADLFRGPMSRPDDAADLLRELVRLNPLDIDSLLELYTLLNEVGRVEEATAAALASISHHRASLRSNGIRDSKGQRTTRTVEQLHRLFTLVGNEDGLYLCAAVLEFVAPQSISATCDDMHDEPWGLPSAQDGNPLDLILGDLPGAMVLSVLQAGANRLAAVPGEPELDERYVAGRALLKTGHRRGRAFDRAVAGNPASAGVRESGPRVPAAHHRRAGLDAATSRRSSHQRCALEPSFPRRHRPCSDASRRRGRPRDRSLLIRGAHRPGRGVLRRVPGRARPRLGRSCRPRDCGPARGVTRRRRRPAASGARIRPSLRSA
jgi:tetratricopeptide (TPR) repeat protein